MKQVLLALILVLPGFAEVDDKAGVVPRKESGNVQPLVLEPMMVYGDTRLAFGFGLRITRIENPRVVLDLVVDRVQVGSDAERKGLRPGSKIVSINGRDVSQYEATFEHGSELNRILVDRPEGARVTMQVLVPGKKKPQTLTIVRRTLLYEPAKIGGILN